MTSTFAVANVVGGLATGYLAERAGARRLVAGGIGVYAVANILIATASAALPLVAWRTVAGLGGGISQVAERLYLTSIVDRASLAAANGLLSSAGAAGAVLGPVIGGILATFADVRAPFIVVGVTSLIGAVAALFLPVPAGGEGRDAIHPGPDSTTPTADDPDTPAPAVSDAPGIIRTLIVLFVIQTAFQTAFGAFITSYAPFAAERLAWSTGEISLVFGLFALGTILVGPWLGGIADRRGRRDVAILSCALVALSPIVLAVEAPRWIVYPATVIAGAGVTGLEAAWFALLGEATDGGRQTRRFGAVSSVANLGIVAGATVASQLWERSGDIGIGLVVTTLALGVSAAGLVALPRDRGASGASTAVAVPT